MGEIRNALIFLVRKTERKVSLQRHNSVHERMGKLILGSNMDLKE
jgi:hypothetical protein